MLVVSRSRWAWAGFVIEPAFDTEGEVDMVETKRALRRFRERRPGFDFVGRQSNGGPCRTKPGRSFTPSPNGTWMVVTDSGLPSCGRTHGHDGKCGDWYWPGDTIAMLASSCVPEKVAEAERRMAVLKKLAEGWEP